jgi:hypothetical protein
MSAGETSPALLYYEDAAKPCQALCGENIANDSRLHCGKAAPDNNHTNLFVLLIFRLISNRSHV